MVAQFTASVKQLPWSICVTVTMVTGLQDTDLGIVVRFPVEVKDLSLLRNIQHSSGAHPASYAMHKGGRFYPRG